MAKIYLALTMYVVIITMAKIYLVLTMCEAYF